MPVIVHEYGIIVHVHKYIAPYFLRPWKCVAYPEVGPAVLAGESTVGELDNVTG